MSAEGRQALIDFLCTSAGYEGIRRMDVTAVADAILAAFEVRPREASDPELCSEECGWCGENMPAPPIHHVRQTLANAWAAHRPTARNGWSGCTCGEENPGLTVNLDRWHEAHLLSSLVDALAEVRPRGTVTDAEVEAAGRALYGVSWGDEALSDPYLVRAALEAARASE